MTSKTAVAAGLAALALPAAAVAEKPAEPGKHGRENAAAKQQAAQERQAEKRAEKTEKAAKPAKKVKRVGFSLKGTGLTSVPVADGALTGGFVLDPTSANKHARTLLGLTKTEIKGDTLTDAFGVTGDEVVVRYEGLSETDALQPTDVVKVVGKVERSGKGKAKTLGALDIRRVTITREAPEDENENETETEQPEQPESGS